MLRDGKVAATLETADTDKRQLARLMVGRDVLFNLEKSPFTPGRSRAGSSQRARGLSDRGLPALKDVSLVIRRGEILGIAGVAGNGQRELAEVITGLRKAGSGQNPAYTTSDVTNASPRRIIDERVSHMPEDRLGMGLIPNLPLSDNAILKGYVRPPFSHGPFLDGAYIRRFVQQLIDASEISAPSQETPVKLLSGWQSAEDPACQGD